MPQPTLNDSHIDAVLTNISIAYIQSTENFVSTKVFPTIPTSKKSNLYYTYPRNQWFRDEAARRPDATESAGSGYELDSDSFNCDVYAFHKDVGDQTVANTDVPLNAYRDATSFVTSRLVLRQEIQWATDFFTTGVWTGITTGVAGVPGGSQCKQWSDYTNSDPITDVEAAKDSIHSTTGFLPNTLVIGHRVFRFLKHHPDIRDRYKWTTAEQVTPGILANLFEVDRILVARGIKATNDEGDTAAYSNIHGNAALLCYSNPNPGLLAPSAGYVFQWTGVSEGLGTEIGVSRFRQPQLKAERIEGQIAWTNKKVAADLGHFFASIVTATG
jgi:hypothetical protein